MHLLTGSLATLFEYRFADNKSRASLATGAEPPLRNF